MEDAPEYPEDANLADDWQLTSADVGEEAAADPLSYHALGGSGAQQQQQQQQQQQALASAGGGGGYLAASSSRGFQPSMLVGGFKLPSMTLTTCRPLMSTCATSPCVPSKCPGPVDSVPTGMGCLRVSWLW